MKRQLVRSFFVTLLALLSSSTQAAEALDFYVGYKQVEAGTLEGDHFLELGLENEVRSKGFRQIKMTLDQLSAQLDQIIKSEVMKKSSRGSSPKAINGGSSLSSVNTFISTQVVGSIIGNAKSVISVDPVQLKADSGKDKKISTATLSKMKTENKESLPADEKAKKEYKKFNPNFKARDYSFTVPTSENYESVVIDVKAPSPVTVKSPEFEGPNGFSPVKTHEAPRDRSLAIKRELEVPQVTTVIVKESSSNEKIAAVTVPVRDSKSDNVVVSTDTKEQTRKTAKSTNETSTSSKVEKDKDKSLPKKEVQNESDPCIVAEVVGDVFRAMNKIKKNTDEAVYTAAQEFNPGTVSCSASFRGTVKLANSLGCEKGDFSLGYREWDPVNEPFETFFDRQKKCHSSVAAWLNSPSNQMQSGDAFSISKILDDIKMDRHLSEEAHTSVCLYANYLRIVSYTFRFRDEAGITRVKEYEENEKKGKGASGGVIVVPGLINKSKPAAAPASVPKKHPG